MSNSLLTSARQKLPSSCLLKIKATLSLFRSVSDFRILILAVNKKNGLVYLIPIEVVEQSKEKVSTNEMKKYLEYWSIFDELVNQKIKQKLRARKWKARIR